MTPTAASAIIALLSLACGVLIWRNLRLRRRLRSAHDELRRGRATPAPTAPRKSQKTDDHARLMKLLDLPLDALPRGGDWRVGDDLLLLLVERMRAEPPEHVVELGSGLSTAVIARQMELTGRGRLWSIEHDAAFLEQTQETLDQLGLSNRVTLIEAELTPWDKHTQWYDRAALGALPERIDLLLIDGPPHHAGRTPRHPAGPELFGRLAENGLAILDDGRRQKEQKALTRWAEELPEFSQTPTDTAKQAVLLRRRAAATQM
ncbi:MAG: class I SAM-dependent methyltransferase [Pseudomonadota bacterium]